jgi:hypothetical protein
MKIVSFSLENGNKYFGKIDGTRFAIGTRVNYLGGKGLMNVSGSAEQKYDRAAHRAEHGFWADFIHPTAMAEGAYYHTLNTYDRALFTFSFLQFAAHVPNGDFVLYLRALLALPLAKEYFPDLELSGNRICRQTDDGLQPLETDASTALLQDYLNPTSKEVEDTEVIQSARFVHWAQNDAAHRDAQVSVGVERFQSNLAAYAKQYSLDGASAVVCLLVCDIRHQGRAKSPVIVAALQSANPVNSLLAIGDPQYHERIVALRREIKVLTDDGTFGALRYNLARRDFV